MTQIVGIICKESIVVACESQHTIASRKQNDAEKMSVVKFTNGAALVVEAGVTTNSARIVRYMSELAKYEAIENEFSVSKIAEVAMAKVRGDILAGMQKRHYSLKEQEEFFGSSGEKCGLMIAHFFEAEPKLYKPCLYTITLETALAELEFPFAVLGAADRLAAFILKQFKYEELLWGEAASLAIESLERIKDDDIHCGGQIRLAMIDPKINENYPHPVFMQPHQVRKIVGKLDVLRAKNAGWYKREFSILMKKVHQEIISEWRKDQRADTRRRLKAFEKKYPESTLAIGYEAVKALAEKWNLEHPEQPVPLPDPPTNAP